MAMNGRRSRSAAAAGWASSSLRDEIQEPSNLLPTVDWLTVLPPLQKGTPRLEPRLAKMPSDPTKLRGRVRSQSHFLSLPISLPTLFRHPNRILPTHVAIAQKHLTKVLHRGDMLHPGSFNA
jgi:hypothetical protein